MNEFEKHIQSNVYTMTDRAIVLCVTKKTDWTLQDILDALPSYHSQNSLKNYLTKFFTQEEIEKHANEPVKSRKDLFAAIRKLAENYDKDYIRHVAAKTSSQRKENSLKTRTYPSPSTSTLATDACSSGRQHPRRKEYKYE